MTLAHFDQSQIRTQVGVRFSSPFGYPTCLRYVYTRPDRNSSESGRIGICYMDPCVYTGLFWSRSRTDPNSDLRKSRSSFGSVWSGPVPEHSLVNRRSTRYRRFSNQIHLEPIPWKYGFSFSIVSSGTSTCTKLQWNGSFSTCIYLWARLVTNVKYVNQKAYSLGVLVLSQVSAKYAQEPRKRFPLQAVRWCHEISRQIEWAGRERLGTRLWTQVDISVQTRDDVPVRLAKG